MIKEKIADNKNKTNEINKLEELDNIHCSSSKKHFSHSKSQHIWFEIKTITSCVLAILLTIPFWISMGKYNPLSVSLGNPLIQLFLAIFIQFILGFHFYKYLYIEWFKNKHLGMYTLIILSSFTAFTYSIYLIFLMWKNSPYVNEHILGLFQGVSIDELKEYMLKDNNYHHMYFEVGVSIVTFVLLGNTISQIIQQRAVDGLENLVSLQVKKAILIKDNEKHINIDANNIKVNDLLLVKKGEKVPTDGILISKMAYLNESLITGESQIIKKEVNDSLIGGSINDGETFIMKALKIGKDTILASIINKVTELQKQKTGLQKIADKIAGFFVPFVLILSILVFIIYAFILPLFNLDFIMKDRYGIATKTAISTLVIACPCALGLATPLATTVGIVKSSQEGIIFNKVQAFEKINKIDIVAFDKTGTITDGNLSISEFYGDLKNLEIIVSLESMSSHPIANAFILYSEQFSISKVPVSNVKEIVGFGMQGKYKEKKVTISSLNNLLDKGYILNNNLEKNVMLSKNKSDQLIIGFAINEKIMNIFVFHDQIKLNAKQTILALKKAGIEVYMISGDSEMVTERIANEVGIENYFSRVNPLKKAEIIKELQVKNKYVAYVGDGINDSVALEQANLSLAMGKGSEVAVNLSDIIIIKPDIFNIYKAIVLTKQTRKVILTNFMWAFGYNFIALPLVVLSGWFWSFVPNFEFAVVCALAMAFSDITVVLNSLYYRWKNIWNKKIK